MASQGDDCYFFYYSSCAKGESCPFRHQPAAFGNETVCELWRQQKCFRPYCQLRHMELDSNRKSIPCYWERQASGCLKSHCPFSHSKPRQLANIAKVPPLDCNSSPPGKVGPPIPDPLMSPRGPLPGMMPLMPDSMFARHPPPLMPHMDRPRFPIHEGPFGGGMNNRQPFYADVDMNYRDNLHRMRNRFPIPNMPPHGHPVRRHPGRPQHFPHDNSDRRKRKSSDASSNPVIPPKEVNIADNDKAEKPDSDNVSVSAATVTVPPDTTQDQDKDVQSYEDILREKALRKMYERRQQQQQQQSASRVDGSTDPPSSDAPTASRVDDKIRSPAAAPASQGQQKPVGGKPPNGGTQQTAEKAIEIKSFEKIMEEKRSRSGNTKTSTAPSKETATPSARRLQSETTTSAVAFEKITEEKKSRSVNAKTVAASNRETCAPSVRRLQPEATPSSVSAVEPDNASNAPAAKVNQIEIEPSGTVNLAVKVVQPPPAVEVKSFEEVMKEKRLRRGVATSTATNVTQISTASTNAQLTTGNVSSSKTQENFAEMSRTQRIRVKRITALAQSKKSNSAQLEKEEPAERESPASSRLPSISQMGNELWHSPSHSATNPEMPVGNGNHACASPEERPLDPVCSPSKEPRNDNSGVDRPDPRASPVQLSRTAMDSNSKPAVSSPSPCSKSDVDEDFELDLSSDDDDDLADHSASFNDDDDLLREIDDLIHS